MSGRQLQAARKKAKGKGGNNKRKGKDYKFATKEQAQRGNYATFNSVKEKVVTYVQKTFEFGRDISTAICDIKKLDPITKQPTRKKYKISAPATETAEERKTRVLKEADG